MSSLLLPSNLSSSTSSERSAFLFEIENVAQLWDSVPEVLSASYRLSPFLPQSHDSTAHGPAAQDFEMLVMYSRKTALEARFIPSFSSLCQLLSSTALVAEDLGWQQGARGEDADMGMGMPSYSRVLGLCSAATTSLHEVVRLWPDVLQGASLWLPYFSRQGILGITSWLRENRGKDQEEEMAGDDGFIPLADLFFDPVFTASSLEPLDGGGRPETRSFFARPGASSVVVPDKCHWSHSLSQPVQDSLVWLGSIWKLFSSSSSFFPLRATKSDKSIHIPAYVASLLDRYLSALDGDRIWPHDEDGDLEHLGQVCPSMTVLSNSNDDDDDNKTTSTWADWPHPGCVLKRSSDNLPPEGVPLSRSIFSVTDETKADKQSTMSLSARVVAFHHWAAEKVSDADREIVSQPNGLHRLVQPKVGEEQGNEEGEDLVQPDLTALAYGLGLTHALVDKVLELSAQTPPEMIARAARLQDLEYDGQERAPDDIVYHRHRLGPTVAAHIRLHELVTRARDDIIRPQADDAIAALAMVVEYQSRLQRLRETLQGLRRGTGWRHGPCGLPRLVLPGPDIQLAVLESLQSSMEASAKRMDAWYYGLKAAEIRHGDLMASLIFASTHTKMSRR